MPIRKFKNLLRYGGIVLALGALGLAARVGTFLRSTLSTGARGVFFVLKIVFLDSVLNLYFLLLRLRRRFKTHLSAGLHRLLTLATTYLYRLAIVAFIVSTVCFNLFAKKLGAEELKSTQIINQLVPGTSVDIVQLFEEGPLRKEQRVLSYLDPNTVTTSDELNAVIGLPDADDDGAYATTEGETAVIAPVLTTPGAGGVGRRDKIEVYTVGPGDTLGIIAEQYDISINTILWQNNLSYSSTLRPGQELSILPSDGVTHTVKAGDTVNAIAKKYQADPANIISKNKLADASDIRVGEVLIVPSGIKPTTLASRPPQRLSLPNIIQDIFTGTPPPDTGAKLFWPLLSHRITQYFGYRHTGVDVGDKRGNPIFAAESGKVEESGWNRGGYGYRIVINHGNGIKTLYAHNSKLLVAVGETVTRGQVIALIGSTGRSTGPHLHFEVRINGRFMNPLNYLR
ncbi:MAG: hypothetical protein A3B30_01095 [Candidatus Komeilibacteria bacterium RIFCSPLOWO2_01_FULL_52_15]|uniref:LysM domain-containing protein n=2 Tax=Candidatus Komeiliibacteriota TaxID=1817908 RepID=A0A1G2BS25_9BACT|nr:MAG: hypothetical protein A2677_01575 [Candidatus Komeilibacteria bacterium RIFCSPHIGHO2_01_FULL_52_14]OGY91858.1 MAG: hypothetical protein A3B30_01095 [Candidatus Komeilibacteria bacterium RIFCSPLOWO2_01_FULL_52_15]